jgi:hypothetical protein
MTKDEGASITILREFVSIVIVWSWSCEDHSGCGSSNSCNVFIDTRINPESSIHVCF